MGRQVRRKPLVDSILGQHMALSVAAHLARTQLVANPANVYDGRHLTDMIDAIARGLAMVAPIYVLEGDDRRPRELAPLELEGAIIAGGATRLVLRDGRTLNKLSIRRADFRQALTVLRALGITHLIETAQRPTAKDPSA